MTKLVADKLKTAPLTSTEVGKGLRIRRSSEQLNQEPSKSSNTTVLVRYNHPTIFQEVSNKLLGIVQRQKCFFQSRVSVNKEDSNISFPDEIIGESDSAIRSGYRTQTSGNSSMKFETVKSGSDRIRKTASLVEEDLPRSVASSSSPNSIGSVPSIRVSSLEQ